MVVASRSETTSLLNPPRIITAKEANGTSPKAKKIVTNDSKTVNASKKSLNGIGCTSEFNMKYKRNEHYLSPSVSKRLRKIHRRLKKNIVILLGYWAVIAFTIIIFFGPLVLSSMDRSDWCHKDGLGESRSNSYTRMMKTSKDTNDDVTTTDVYENPDYITDLCRYTRVPQLFYLTLEECDLCRRLFASVLFGGAIGYERRSADRPAGIRTMGLVSLGSCFFTISSQLAFKSSTMSWDSSRVTAAIPSGVGFLGAGLIWKGSVSLGDEEVHQVHGLTTAASVWLSAAVGVGAGGSLYFVTAYSLILVMLILRYGPKMYLQEDDQYHNDHPSENDASTDDDLYDPYLSKDIDADNRDNEDSDNAVVDMIKNRDASFSRMVQLDGGTDGGFEIDENDIALLKAWKLRRQSLDDDSDHGSITVEDIQSSTTIQNSNVGIQSAQNSVVNGLSYGSIAHSPRSRSNSLMSVNASLMQFEPKTPPRSKPRKIKKFQGPSFHS